MKKNYSYDDVLLEPQFSDIESRKEIDISANIGSHIYLSTPIISAPMDTVTNQHMANALNECGALGVIHRYNTIQEQLNSVKGVNVYRAAAIGTTGDWQERALALVNDGNVNALCVDIAHGHHILMKRALEWLRDNFDNTHIMAGNVATLKAFDDLSDWGADSIRVGIGGGSTCSTRIITGHGVPSLSCVLECAKSDRDAVLIADGGIKSSGDIVKALAAGADVVMVGSLLAGCAESPGEVFHRGGLPYKTYRGMSSVESQIDWRGHYSSIEGVSHVVPFKGRVAEVIDKLNNGIRSGLSYSGARNIMDFQTRARLIIQTSAGSYESGTHIKDRF